MDSDKISYEYMFIKQNKQSIVIFPGFNLIGTRKEIGGEIHVDSKDVT